MTTNESTVLTEEFLLKRSNENSLINIKTLNLFALNINDLSIFRSSFRRFTNLTILNLVQNNIRNIDSIIYCPNLAELYLRKNNIEDLVSLVPLTLLPRLVILWLDDNVSSGPGKGFEICQQPYYRTYVLYLCKSLEKLDTWTITEAERKQYHPQQYLNTKDEKFFEELVRSGNIKIQKLRFEMNHETTSTIPSSSKKEHSSSSSIHRNNGPIRVHHEGILNSHSIMQQNGLLSLVPPMDSLGGSSPLINNGNNSSTGGTTNIPTTRTPTPSFHNINISFPHNTVSSTKDTVIPPTVVNMHSESLPPSIPLTGKVNKDQTKIPCVSSTSATIVKAISVLLKELDHPSLEKLEKIIQNMLANNDINVVTEEENIQ